MSRLSQSTTIIVVLNGYTNEQDLHIIYFVVIEQTLRAYFRYSLHKRRKKTFTFRLKRSAELLPLLMLIHANIDNGLQNGSIHDL